MSTSTVLGTTIDSPRKQMASGTFVEDVICNSELTLMNKSSSSSAACVKPSTAIKLEKLGWGKILKESSEMDEQREKWIKEIMIDNESVYDPQINPADFTIEITNPYVTLPVGKKIVYDSNTEDGLERIEILITGETKTVMGVETLVYWDRVWFDDQLIEDTRDWLAQDKYGNVWYFGEDVDNYENGQLVDHAGSWEADVNNAKPGYWMKSNPQIGDTYRQEYYAGEAEDMAKVISLDEIVSVEYGTYSGCLKTKDWTPLEPDVIEYKYYCTQVGNMVLEEKLEDEERVELIDVMYDQFSSKITTETTSSKSSSDATTMSNEITEEEAINIAKNTLAGKVTDVGIEYKFGQFVYVVEIRTAEGKEVNVVIDRNTGKVLGLD